MWKCTKCGRVFDKSKQPHSCRRISVEEHFRNKKTAKELFETLVNSVKSRVGNCVIVSLPCCIHLYGNYDFLAALPKKAHLEIRFALSRVLTSPRATQSIPLSQSAYKNCINIFKKEEIDEELLGWIAEAYHLKENS